MQEINFKRLSIALDNGKVIMLTLKAKNLSVALDQEISYYLRAGRTPAEIDISGED